MDTLDSINSLESRKSDHHVFTWRRHLSLFAYALLSSVNAFNWLEYTVLDKEITQALNISQSQLNFSAYVYMLLYIFGGLPASHFLKKYGLRKSLLISAFLNSLGAGIKCLNNDEYMWYFIIAGQIIVASSQLFFYSAITTLTTELYPHEQQNIATSVGVLANAVGSASTFIITPFVIRGDLHFKKDLWSVHIVQFCLSYFVFQLVYISIPANRVQLPESSEDEVAVAQRNMAHRQGTLSIFKKLMSKRRFAFLLIAYSLSIGIFNSFVTFLPRLITYANKSPEEISEKAGELGLIQTISGLTGIFCIGLLLDRYHCYRMISFVLNLIVLISLSAFSFCVHIQIDLNLLIPLSIIIGFSWFAVWAMGYEFAAEITFPLPENVSSSLLAIGSQLFAVIFILLGEVVLESYGVWIYECCCLALFFLVLFFNLCTEQPLLRQQAIHGHPVIEDSLENEQTLNCDKTILA